MTDKTPLVDTADFGFLARHDVQLMRLDALAERYFGAEEPLGSSFQIVSRTEKGAGVRQSGTPPANQNSDPRQFRGHSVD
jgi:hypothetical protein